MIVGSVVVAGPPVPAEACRVNHLSEPARRLGSCGKNGPGPTLHDGYPQLTSIRTVVVYGLLSDGRYSTMLRIARAGASCQQTTRSFQAQGPKFWQKVK